MSAVRVWALALAVGCGGGAPSPGTTSPPSDVPASPSAPPPEVAPPPAPSVAPASSEAASPPSDAGWTAGLVAVERPSPPPATLVEVRTGRHDGFDRVVFQFADHVPGYHVAYVDRPVRACGSGDVVPVEGDAWLEVRLDLANAHTPEGRVTVAERDRRTPELANLRQLVLTCDFEATTTWVLGAGTPGRFRVTELAAPPRLVVDVRQR